MASPLASVRESMTYLQDYRNRDISFGTLSRQLRYRIQELHGQREYDC